MNDNKEEKRLEAAALLLLSLGNTPDIDERKPLRYCRWTAAEDRLLAQLVKKKYGTWKKIAARIPGRTVRQTRSRWLKLCKKYQLALKGKQEEIDTKGRQTYSPPEFMKDISDDDEEEEEQKPPSPELTIRRITPHSYKFAVEDYYLYASKEPIQIPIEDRVIVAYQCLFPACNRIFKTYQNLIEHVTVHNNECGKK